MLSENDNEKLSKYMSQLEEVNPTRWRAVKDTMEKLLADTTSTSQQFFDVMNANPVEYKKPEQPKIETPEVSYWREDPNYVGNLSWQQHLMRADADPRVNVRNSDGSVNRELLGKYINSEMAKATAEDRHRIANGSDLGGWFASPESFAHHLGAKVEGFFLPRVQESIEAGTYDGLRGWGLPGSLSDAKDFALDVGQNALEALPYGRLLGAGTKRLTGRLAGRAEQMLAKSSNILGKALDASVAPVAMEALDAAAYDPDENPMRSEFSTLDALFGIGTNIATPYFIKRGAGALSRFDIPGKKMWKSISDPDLQGTYEKTIARNRGILENAELGPLESQGGKATPGINYNRKTPEDVIKAENILAVDAAIRDGLIDPRHKTPLYRMVKDTDLGGNTIDHGSNKRLQLDEFGVLRTDAWPDGVRRSMVEAPITDPKEYSMARTLFDMPDRSVTPGGTTDLLSGDMVQRNRLIQQILHDNPELQYRTMPLSEILGGAMPSNYFSNKLGQEDYGTRIVQLVPGLGDELKTIREEDLKERKKTAPARSKEAQVARRQAEKESNVNKKYSDWSKGFNIPMPSDPEYDEYIAFREDNLNRIMGVN